MANKNFICKCATLIFWHCNGALIVYITVVAIMPLNKKVHMHYCQFAITKAFHTNTN